MTTPDSVATPVFVVYRVEPDIRDPGTDITIMAVLPTEAEAAAEVRRLDRVNAGSGVRHFFQRAEGYPAGRAANEPG